MTPGPYFYQLAGRSIPQVLILGTSIAMVRQAGVGVVGQYAVSVAVATLLFGTMASAIDTHILRKNARAEVFAGLAAKGLLWLASLPAMGGVLAFLGIPLVPGLLFCAGVLLGRFADLVVVHHRMQACDHRAVAPRAVPPLLFLLMQLGLRPDRVEEVALLFLISWLAVLPFLRGIVTGSPRPSWAEVVAVAGGARSIFASLVFTQVYGNADIILLKLFLGDAAAGTYKVALSFAGVALPMIGVFSFIYLSRVGEIARRGDPGEIRHALHSQVTLNGTVGAVFLASMFAALPWAIPFIYGPELAAAVTPAVILCGAAAANCLSMAFSYTLLALSKDRLIVYVVAIAAACNLLLNLALIPAFGLIGGAVASVATHLIITAGLAFLTVHSLPTAQGRPAPAHGRCP